MMLLAMSHKKFGSLVGTVMAVFHLCCCLLGLLFRFSDLLFICYLLIDFGMNCMPVSITAVIVVEIVNCYNITLISMILLLKQNQI